MLLLLVCQAGFSQGFVNLNFERAKIVPDAASLYYPYAIAITNALPGWFCDGTQQGDITYNDQALGSSWITLWATNGQQISGKYSLYMQGGLGPGVSISQTGLVPASSLSLLFEAQPDIDAASGSLVISLGGNNLPYFAISTGANYTLFGADISAYAGQTAQLKISALSGYYNNWNIDNFQFSTTYVPEPGVLGLSALGGLLLACRRRKARAI